MIVAAPTSLTFRRRHAEEKSSAFPACLNQPLKDWRGTIPLITSSDNLSKFWLFYLLWSLISMFLYLISVFATTITVWDMTSEDTGTTDGVRPFPNILPHRFAKCPRGAIYRRKHEPSHTHLYRSIWISQGAGWHLVRSLNSSNLWKTSVLMSASPWLRPLIRWIRFLYLSKSGSEAWFRSPGKVFYVLCQV